MNAQRLRKKVPPDRNRIGNCVTIIDDGLFSIPSATTVMPKLWANPMIEWAMVPPCASCAIIHPHDKRAINFEPIDRKMMQITE